MADDPPEPVQLDFERLGDQFGIWSYRHNDFRCTIDHFYESHGTLSAEVLFCRFDGTDFYGPARINLMSPRARHDLARTLAQRDGHLPWATLMDATVALVVREWRREESPARAVPRLLGAVPYLIGPLVPKAVATVLYGDGGVGKSTIAEAVALSVATGACVVPGTIPTAPAPVLYLDWEESEATFDDRLARLMAGAGIENQGDLYFARMHRPLTDGIDRLRVQVDRQKIALVVIDSFAYAAGPEPESADAAMRVFGSLRALGDVATLIICHVSKGSMSASGSRSPYGSVFVRNSARMTWEARGATSESDDDPGATIGLYNDKHNLSRRMPPVGLRVTYQDDAIRFAPADVPRTPSMLSHATSAQVILDFIRAQRLVTNAEIAQATGIPTKTVNSATLRFEEQKLIERLPRTGKTAPIQWFYTGPVPREAEEREAE